MSTKENDNFYESQKETLEEKEIDDLRNEEGEEIGGHTEEIQSPTYQEEMKNQEERPEK